MRKVIISVAPTPAGVTAIDPAELAREVLAARRAGAAMVHMHVRDSKGQLTADMGLYQETVERITRESDIVIQASTGGLSELTIEQRCAPVTYAKVETVSLNVGSVNLGGAIYRNPLGEVRYCVEQILAHGKIPEIEIFELGMIQTVLELDKEYHLPKPLLFDLVLGHQGGAPATVEALIALRSCVPPGALWGITHARRSDYTIIAAAVAMGASLVRIGFEDSDYLTAHTRASSNDQLVAKIAGLIEAMELKVASPDEVREMLHIG
ncbi:3-keto-5-aminohexanoate cleavage protein [Paenibacillus sp. MMS20-IR301]|uniref:3-keto-5-aminohexanoate cleavage protein n=1 Tax=Paenibacillus sp. MMS20-IR301 TaxID=2895946 RepID=UPI0028EB8778|nr:3-keto-5-aminohexanoate cleavage protein [Paenibacillus sp. MMS20-IR301]WNS46660.1 3-keto-5-aminohexanoate cleavage protein [Paenibacillus sp. MMS20-IR301]